MRPTKHETFLEVAQVLSHQGTCIRRQVGCVLVNSKHHIIGTGYNGPASGQRHCVDTPCKGSQMLPAHGLEQCEAIHAEQNALLQCHDVYQIERAYVTTPPCLHCIKLFMNTSCQQIFVQGTYPMAHQSELLWLRSHPDRLWVEMT